MPEPGWYDDPTGESEQRWWDGERWTEHVLNPGTPTVPPPPTPPSDHGVGATIAAPLTPPAPSFPIAAAPTSSAGGSRSPLLIVAAVVGVLAIAGIAVVLLTRGGSGTEGIETGHRVDLAVEADGNWLYEFEAPAGTLVIDVRGDGSFDPVAYLEDASGRELAMNDDRSAAHLEQYGGDAFDSLIEIEVAAGSYRLRVEEWSGQAGTGQAVFPVVGG